MSPRINERSLASWKITESNSVLVAGSPPNDDDSTSTARDIIQHLTSIWRAPEPGEVPVYFNRGDLYYNFDTGLAEVKSNLTTDEMMEALRDLTSHQLGPLLSPHLTLYRLRCLFPKLVVRQHDCFKCIFEFKLSHNRDEKAVFHAGEHRTIVTARVRHPTKLCPPGVDQTFPKLQSLEARVPIVVNHRLLRLLFPSLSSDSFLFKAC